MANILITGGAGFIGSHTADALIERGHHVRLLDLLDQQVHGETTDFPSYLNPAVECLQGDVCNMNSVRAALEGIDAVYHFAAQTGVGQSMYDIRSYVNANCVGTATLLEAIIKDRLPIHRLVLASSRAVYGEGTHTCPVHGAVYPGVRERKAMEQGKFAVSCPHCGKDAKAVPTQEDRPLNPVSVYGWTKKQQEEQCQYAAATFGLPLTVLRYFNVYGSRQSLKNPYTGVMTVFFNRILSGQPIFLYENGTPLRDFVHVSDVVQANLLALELENDTTPGTCINVGSGQRHTISDIANALAHTCGREAQLENSGQFRIGDIHACIADLNRAHEILGYLPRISLEEGVREFSDWAAQQERLDLYDKTVAELKRHGLIGGADQSN